jgi:hypothetical protein
MTALRMSGYPEIKNATSLAWRLRADSVEKVENRTTPKISQMSVFGRFRSPDAP